MALQGSLADIGLPDVIQLVSVSAKTGVFTLSGDGVDGKIFIKDGQITDAIAGKLSGEYAVYEIGHLAQGPVHLHRRDRIGQDHRQKSPTRA